MIEMQKNNETNKKEIDIAVPRKYKFDNTSWQKIDAIISYFIRADNTNLCTDAITVRNSLLAQSEEIVELQRKIKELRNIGWD